GEPGAYVLDDVRLAQRRAVAAHDRGRDDLAPARVRYAEHRRLGDGRMLEEAALDLGGEHVLAAALDHLLHAAGDVEEALVVDGGGVAGAEPAAAERVRRRLGHAPVAEHRVLAPADDLASFTGRDVRSVGVDDAHVDVRGGTPDGGRLPQDVERP